MTEQVLNQQPNQVNEPRHSKKKKKSKRILGKVIFTLLVMIIFVSMGFTIKISFDKIKEQNEKIEELNKLNSEMEKLIPTGEYIYEEDLKNKTIQYGVSISLFQKLFPENAVFFGKNGINFMPINESLPKNNLDKNSFKQDEEEGFIYFNEKNGKKAKKGIDVSTFQKEINWKKVKESGIDFAIIRCGFRGYHQGKLVEDSMFRKNIEGALNNDIDVGVYFFSQAVSEMEAREEAEFVYELIKEYNITYPVIFDMEEIADDNYRTEDLIQEERTNIALSFCEQIEKYGYTPMIYGNIYWLLENYDIEKIMKYDIWFAQYQKNLYFPYEIDMWQYTHKGRVDGIEGDVDFNLCFKDYTKK